MPGRATGCRRAQEALPELAFGLNVHYHVGPGAEEDDRRRDGRGAVYALLLAAGCVGGALLARLPWSRVLSSGARRRVSQLRHLVTRLQSLPSSSPPQAVAAEAASPGSADGGGQGAPAKDALELINREKRRLAVAAAAEARASEGRGAELAALTPSSSAGELDSALAAAAGILLGHAEEEGQDIPLELRQEIAVLSEEVRVFQADAAQADLVRRAVQKEAEAAERAAAAACEAHANAKEKLWRSEERLSSLLQKAKKHSSSLPPLLEARGGQITPNGDARVSEDGGAQEPVLAHGPSITPSYIS